MKSKVHVHVCKYTHESHVIIWLQLLKGLHCTCSYFLVVSCVLSWWHYSFLYTVWHELLCDINDLKETFKFHTAFSCNSYTPHTHAAANLNWRHLKYMKVALVHYFCTIALRTPHTVLTHVGALHRVDLHVCRVVTFAKWLMVMLIIFNVPVVLDLVKYLIYHIINETSLFISCMN